MHWFISHDYSFFGSVGPISQKCHTTGGQMMNSRGFSFVLMRARRSSPFFLRCWWTESLESPHSAALSVINLSALPFFSWPLSSLPKKVGANYNLCNPTDFVSVLPHPFMTHSMDCNASWETSAACCCWREPLTPNKPT